MVVNSTIPFIYVRLFIYTFGREIKPDVRYSVGLVLYNFKTRKREKVIFSSVAFIKERPGILNPDLKSK